MTAKTIYITPEEYDIAAKNGISALRVYNRVNYRRWTIERAITEPLKPRGYKEEHEKFVADRGKENCVTYETYRKRRKKGMVAIAAIKKAAPPKLCKADKARAALNGISEGTLEIRVYNYHWSVERAVTEPINEQFRSKTRKGRVM